MVAIIAVIAGMLFPVFSRARAAARKTTCSSNLRQVGMALTMYADDYDTWGPPVSGWHRWGGVGTEGDQWGPGWEERIDPYVKSKGIFCCPSFGDGVEFSYFLNTRAHWLTYGFWSGSFGVSWITFSSIRYPSCYVMAGDCSNPRLLPAPLGSSPHAWDSCDKDNMTYRCLFYHNRFHGNGSNVLYADGHVKFATGFDGSRMTFSPYCMTDWQ